jgi:hypothetical protein
MARQPVILFNDIDFLGAPEMYRQIHAEAMRRDIAANMFDFFCVPVLFLTEQGTGTWLAKTAAGRPFVERADVDWLESADADVQFTAFGSSAIVANRHHYLSLGGHDPKFSGHGAEDYDLLHRLASLAPKGPRPNDYFTDFKDNGLRNYWGFRPFYALHGLDVFARGLHLAHLWHPRRMEKGYFRPRPNFRYLRKAMLRFDRRGAMPMPLGDLRRESRWLVFYRTAKDLALIRQLLPFARHFRLVRTRSLPAAYGLARLMDLAAADLILIAPEVGGDRGEFATEASRAKIPLLSLQAGATPDSCRVVYRHHDGKPEIETVATARFIASRQGRPLFRFWKHIALDGDIVLESGDIPPPEPLTSPIFATFGGVTLLDRSVHPRPARKRKSSLWVKMKRRFSGY